MGGEGKRGLLNPIFPFIEKSVGCFSVFFFFLVFTGVVIYNNIWAKYRIKQCTRPTHCEFDVQVDPWLLSSIAHYMLTFQQRLTEIETRITFQFRNSGRVKYIVLLLFSFIGRVLSSRRDNDGKFR